MRELTHEYPNRATVPAAYHLAAAAFVAFCLWLASSRPDAYRDAMQEDRLIEWVSVFFYAAAGAALLVRSARKRRWFDVLVGLFLLFVAGEEMSWGQRLFGLVPPSYFLEHNTQQEMNVHNFAGVFGGPKGPFTLVLMGYAIVMPLVALVPMGRAVLARIGATPPPIASLPWFVAAIVLFLWYPVSFTGEWTELLAGSAFFVANVLVPRVQLLLVPASLAGAAGLSAWSARGSDDPRRVTCARAELAAIGDALRVDVLGAGRAHKRIWTFVGDERIELDSLRSQLAAVPCDDDNRDARRRYAVDPWGTAYWMRLSRDGLLVRATIYSFGPNRRRDSAEDLPGGDDIVVQRTLTWP